MNVRIRGKSDPLRSTMSFGVSGWVHGSILAWLALSPGQPRVPRSLYEQEIQPHEKHLVWYSVRDRLPDIGPSSSHKDIRPPRAREKFNQTIVAGAEDLPRPKQLISMPAPEIKLPEPLPLPNVVRVSPPPRPVKLFTPPVEKPIPTQSAAIPEAPRVTPKVDAQKLPFDPAIAKPVPRAFTPPVAKPKLPANAAIPEAPTVNPALQAKVVPIAIPDPRAPARAFTAPPPSRPKVMVAAPLPDAPDTPSVATAGLPNEKLPFAVADPHAPLRTFKTPPPSRTKGEPLADLPSAPEAGRPASRVSSEASLAIVGMNPAKVPDFPTPPGSRAAGFSAGPEIRPKGGDGGVEGNPMIVVPGLLVRGGAKDDQPTLVANAAPTSRESLLAAARTALGAAPTVPAESRATRVSSAPDPRLAGRATYTVAIQMPNITSYSGSWIVWFAERETLPGSQAFEMRPPIPQRKVDPKYIAAAAAERVEGKVRLFAVIRKDGHVDSVALLRHLDDRLDRSAQEALAKWVFEPALHNGVPIDVDAVFEIPFRLAPMPLK